MSALGHVSLAMPWAANAPLLAPPVVSERTNGRPGLHKQALPLAGARRRRDLSTAAIVKSPTGTCQVAEVRAGKGNYVVVAFNIKV